MGVKITTLIENNPDDQGQLLYEHGLSFYIEAEGLKLLFDTGKSGEFTKNASALNINLNNLEYCIVSHGHYDHSGGFERFIREVDSYPTVIVGEEFFKPKYKVVDGGEYKYIGNSFEEEFLTKKQIRVRKVKEDIVYLTENLIIFHHFSKHTDYEKRNKRFYSKQDTLYIPDYFDDEIALGIITKKGLVVIVGCAHVGIVNILETISERVHIPIYAVIGGTHLMEANEDRITHTVDAMKDMNIQVVAVSHCTGEEGIRIMCQELKERFLYNNTGTMIEF